MLCQQLNATIIQCGDVLFTQLENQQSASPVNEDMPKQKLILYIFMISFLITLSAIISAVSLGLLSIDTLSLEILKSSGSLKERKQSTRILELLKDPHRLLITLLLCNVMVDMSLPVFLDNLLSPILTILFSATLLLIFADILPQAIAKKYSLSIGANSYYIMKIMFFVLSPVAYPLARVIDKLIGVDPITIYKRPELAALLKLHGNKDGSLLNTEADLMIKCLNAKKREISHFYSPLSDYVMIEKDAFITEEVVNRVNYKNKDFILVMDHKNECYAYIKRNKVLATYTRNDLKHARELLDKIMPVIMGTNTCEQVIQYMSQNSLDMVLVENSENDTINVITLEKLRVVMAECLVDPNLLIKKRKIQL